MSCADCGRAAPIMVGMRPGRDRTEWSLCSRCWVEGVKTDAEPRRKR